MVAYLKLLIAKMKRERFGQSAERGRKRLDQLELQLEDLEASAAEDAVAAGTAETEPTTVRSFARKRPVRGPLPAHLPREPVVVPAPPCGPCCGGRLVKLGEDITETLEVVPRQWKVIQTVREKFTPACAGAGSAGPVRRSPSRPHLFTSSPARGLGRACWAMILCAKFGEHQPLNRQSASFSRQGIELDVSTLADWVGAGTASLAPLNELIRRHVFAAERLHGDDTTVPVLAKGKTVIGRL
jgi:transposase